MLTTLPVHPLTGLTAIGLLRNGAPIWPVLGASDDDADVDGGADDDAHAEGLLADAVDSDDDQDGDAATAKKDVDDDQDEPLREAGQRALAAEKEKRRVATSQARTLKRELAERDRRIEALEAAQQTGDDQGEEVDLDAVREQAKAEAKAEAKTEVLVERVSAKVEALAARRFQDPEDALAHLTRTHEYADFLDGDKIDAEAIKEALDELLEKKPYLAVPAQSDSRRFKGSGDGGAKPVKPARAKSLHEALARKLTSSS